MPLSKIDVSKMITGVTPLANGGTGGTSIPATNLASGVTGTLPVANGGTALTSGFVNGGVNTPSFWAGRTATVSGISANTWTKIPFNTEAWDSDGKYDSSTNYRFTPTVVGKYFYSAMAQTYPSNGVGNLVNLYLGLYKNGTIYSRSTIDARDDRIYEGVPPISGAIELDADDYIEMYVKGATNSDADLAIDGNGMAGSQNWFTAFKIIGA
tara:strand:- start:135 stop:767 length:633 start_codon:yes stop_codon:yes gene_type:complete